MLALGLLIILLPGLAILPFVPGRRDDPMVAIGGAVTFALGLHVVSFWWLKASPVGLVALAGSLAAGGLVGAVILRKQLIQLVRAWRWEPLVLGVFGAIIALRLLPMLLFEVPPGADMTMHSYMARLIQLADGVPSTHRPVLPLDDFGTYAAGLPALCAELAALSGAAIHRSAFVIVALVHVLVSFAVYAWARSRVGTTAALAAALLCSVAVRDPQHHFIWGGNPTVLSLVFVGFGLLALEAVEGAQRRRAVFFGAVVLGASPLTHAVIPFALAFILPPILLWRLARHNAPDRLPIALTALTMASLAALLIAPYLSTFGLSLTEAELTWIHEFQVLPMHVPWGPMWAWPATFPLHVARRLGWFFGLGLVLALVALWRNHRTNATTAITATSVDLKEAAVWFLLAFVLVLNAHPWVLPASYAIYPDRLMLLLVFPAARVCGWAAETSQRPTATLILCAVLAAFPAWRHYLAADGHVAVTPSDVVALEWIAEHTPEDAIIETRYGDAGLWVPAICARTARTAHVNIVYQDEVDPWREAAVPNWAFFGARVIYPRDEVTRESVVNNPDWVLRFEEGQSQVFERIAR